MKRRQVRFKDAWIVFLLALFFGNLVQIFAPPWLGIAFFGIVPLFYAWSCKLDLKDTFSLRPVPLRAWVGVFSAVAGMILMGNFVSILQEPLFWEIKQDPDFQRILELHQKLLLQIPLWAITVIPAIFEELLARGLLYRGLAYRWNPQVAVVVSAILFSLMHMLPWVLLPIFVIGLVLAWLVWKTGSIYPAMVAHFLNNAISAYVLHAGLPDEVFTPYMIHMGVGGTIFLGFAFWWMRNQEPEADLGASSSVS